MSKVKCMGALAAVIVALAGHAQAAPAAATAAQRDAWIEEVLQQLSELRKSQGDLARQVADLHNEVATLKSAGNGAGSAGLMSLDMRDPLYPSMGEASAQVAIVEFSDFQCPFCLRHEQNTLPGLVDKYVRTGKVKYYFVDFPLSFHARAEPSAVAAACAHQQGKFWPMHDRLFQNQSKLGPDLYLQMAADIGLDRAKFQQCLSDPKVKARVADNQALGERAGVQGTPAFIVGRIKDGVVTDPHAISGARPMSDFERVLKQYLPGT